MSFEKNRKRKFIRSDKSARLWYLITIFSVLLVCVSWIFNIGWYRIILIWSTIPFIHIVLFMLANFSAAKYFSKSKKIRIYTILSIASFISANLLFPDGGDIGGMYCFFGLIRNDLLATIAAYISMHCFFLNIVILILELVESVKCKRRSRIAVENEALPND